MNYIHTLWHTWDYHSYYNPITYIAKIMSKLRQDIAVLAFYHVPSAAFITQDLFDVSISQLVYEGLLRMCGITS